MSPLSSLAHTGTLCSSSASHKPFSFLIPCLATLMQVHPYRWYKPLLGSVFTLAGHHFLQPLIIFHDHLHICSSRSIVSLFSGPRIESTTPVSPERSRGSKSPLTCCPHCGNEPRTWRVFCQPIHMAGSCPVLHPTSQVLLLGHTLSQLITNPISITEIALIQMMDLALGPVDLHELHTRQSTQPIQNPLDGTQRKIYKEAKFFFPNSW